MLSIMLGQGKVDLGYAIDCEATTYGHRACYHNSRLHTLGPLFLAPAESIAYPRSTFPLYHIIASIPIRLGSWHTLGPLFPAPA